jgi:hypothetical protein
MTCRARRSPPAKAIVRGALICAMIGAALTPAACAGRQPPPPEYITQEVLIPVPVPCVPDRPELRGEPEYEVTLADLAAATGPTRYRLLWSAFMERTARLAQLEPVVQGCRDVEGSAPP